METLVLNLRTILRNPLRVVLIVFLLGASLMLVAAMVSLNGSAQQELTNVQKQVGTTITITRNGSESPALCKPGRNGCSC